MKKMVIALLAAALMIAALAGCTAANETSVKALVAAVEKTKALNEVEIKQEMNMSINSGEDTMDMPATGTMKYANKDGDFTMESVLDIGVAGQAMQLQSYYTKNMFYTAVNDVKQKYIAAVDAVVNKDYSMMHLSEDMVKSFETAQTEGGVAYKLTMNDEKVSEYLTSMIERSGMGNFTGDPTNYTFRNLRLSYVVDQDGYAAQQKIAFDCTIGSQAMEINTSMDVTVQYINIGQPVTVTLPTDLDAYKDITAELSQMEQKESPAA